MLALAVGGIGVVGQQAAWVAKEGGARVREWRFHLDEVLNQHSAIRVSRMTFDRQSIRTRIAYDQSPFPLISQCAIVAGAYWPQTR